MLRSFELASRLRINFHKTRIGEDTKGGNGYLCKDPYL